MTGAGSTEALTSCPTCGIAFPLGARFCPNCGEPVEPASFTGAPLPATSAGDPLIGRVIADRYRILQLLGRGGMGVVYRVEHVHIGKLMAMKLLSGELAGDPVTLKRFQREAQAVSKLIHPNTVQIFDFGESAHLAYLVMEYLPGRDLATLIHEQGALDFARVAKIGAQIAGSVEEAHQRGIIHRDIKPENVMVLDTPEQHDFVKVLDFGIAKLRDLDEGGMATQKGHLIGTPDYMAPEQIRGDAIDHRVDVYALGALMYEAVTGVPPFKSETPLDVLRKHLTEPLVSPRKRAPGHDIPEQAERILTRAMVKDPRQRYGAMAELRDELLDYLRSIGVEHTSSYRLRMPSVETVATRGDVDRYEGRLRRESRFGKLLGALLLSLVVYGVYAASSQLNWDWSAPTTEIEPNDQPSQANLLVPGRTLSAFLGKRLSTAESDADVYRIDLGDPATGGADEERVADISVTALPNLDLMLELVEKGSARPVLVVDGGKRGEPERIPNVSLRPTTYFVRVREAVSGGAYPTENVSDTYTIALTLAARAADAEREPNDGFEIAEALSPRAPLHGLIGWAKDRDVYCVPASTAVQRVQVSGVPGLDLVLSFLDRGTNAGQRIDRLGPGGGERLELPATKSARMACFTVSAREREDAALADPEHTYQIALD